MKTFIVMTVAMVLSVAVALPSAFAGGKTVWEDGDQSLKLKGDLRFRYETDDNDSKSAPDSKNRTRERIRLRFGAKYKASDNVEAGFRLASGAASLHSPHETLGDGQAGTGGKNADFGVDKAYVKLKNPCMFLWLGKNSFPVKQLTKTWIESDYSPEGIALGYKASNLSLAVGQFVVQYNKNHAANDMAILIGGNYKAKLAGVGLKLAVANLTFDESSRDAADTTGKLKDKDMPGGDASYTYLGAEAHYSMFKLGGEFMSGDADEARRGGAGIAESSDKAGSILYVRAKLSKMFGVRVYAYDLGYASIPLLGAWGSDDFPNTSNYTGTRVQLDINTGMGMKIDLRYYNETTKNNKIAKPGNFKTDALYSGSGKDVTVTRLQANFNVAF